MEHIEKSRFAHIGQSAQESESIKRQSLTFMQDAMRRLWKNKVAVVCVAVILLLTAMSIFAPMVSKFDYREQHYSHTNAPMGTVCNESGAEGEGHVHYFGTDTLGRDIFTRIWMGGRVSLTIAVVSALVDLILGSIYGGISGYFGGTLDIIMMRLLEIINGIPYLIIVILLMMILRPGMMTIIIAYSLVGWIPMARARSGCRAQAAGIHRGGGSHGRGPRAHHRAPPAAQHALRGDRPRDALHPERHLFGGLPQLHRSGYSAADVLVGLAGAARH